MGDDAEYREIGDVYRDLREARKIKRALNREHATKLLIEHKVQFKSSNAGAHLIIYHHSGIIDFWPGTGKFILRNKQRSSGRGIFKLLKRLGINETRKKTAKS